MRPLPLITVLMLSAAPALAEVPKVVADIPAVGSLVAQVMGDLGAPHVLLPAGANAHSYQMKPSDAGALQEADLLVWIGPELTPWLDRAAANLSDGGRLGLLALPETHRQAYGAAEAHDHAGHDHGHDDHTAEDHGHDDHGHDEHAQDDHTHDGHDGHDHSGTDPHAWLDPANGEAWVNAIAAALSEKDPANAATYAANAKAAAEAIHAADTEAAKLLAPATRKHTGVVHDAYGYFTAHYGLTPAIAVALGDASAPSADRLTAIRAQIAQDQAACAFPEVGHDPRLIATVTEGTPARIGGTLDPAGVGMEPGADLYQRLLTGMAQTLADCLSQ